MATMFETVRDFVETCETDTLHTLPGLTRKDIEGMLVMMADHHPDRVWRASDGFLMKFDDGEVRAIYFIEGLDEITVFDVLD